MARRRCAVPGRGRVGIRRVRDGVQPSPPAGSVASWVVMTVAHARDRPDPSGRVTFDRERSLLGSRVRPTFSGAFAARAANGGIGSTATLGWLTVAFLTVAYVGALGQPGDGRVRTFGLASVALYILPEIVFLVLAPVVSADLASGRAGYTTGSASVSSLDGVAAMWCQLAQTTFYLPAGA